jgi:hypothetical protein
MLPETLFRIHLVFGYVAWLLCFGEYIWPRLKSMDRVEAHRAIATVHSFRFVGLVFMLPGVVGNLPAGFATFAAYGDFATGLLAILALLTVRTMPIPPPNAPISSKRSGAIFPSSPRCSSPSTSPRLSCWSICAASSSA